jgi:hypothetical protein
MAKPFSMESASASMLDTIDEIRTTLGGLKGASDQADSDFYEEILAVLPQFVAVGPQSAGKSSVIRRVSGVALPEASTLCTRVATMVQMRRDAAHTVAVILQGPNGESISQEAFHEDAGPDSVRDAVKRAQEKALQGQDKQFVDNHTVLVKVRGPTKPNVTLVDLPGFHTADDTDTKTVNAMVQRYVEMPGTLALHVVKGDQDYGSLLGNDFLRGIQDVPRVTVLTHCDKLVTSSTDDMQRLTTTLNTTSENSSLTVVVLGSAQEDKQEMEALGHLADMDPRLEIGASALSSHLEERIRVHLETQYPKAVEKLQASLTETIARLDEVREQSPAEVLYQMARQIQNTYEHEKPKLMNDLRVVLADMTQEIKNFEVKPLKGTTRHLRAVDNFDECEPGQKLKYAIDPKTGWSSVVVTGIDENRILWREASPAVGTEPRTGSDNKLKFYICHCAALETMIEDIKLLAEDRGMRNLVHIDRQPIVAQYARAFAEHYTEVCRDTASLIQKKVDTFFNTIFSKDVPDIAKSAASRLRARHGDGLKKAGTACQEAIEALEAHNTRPDLIFTPNEHYLNDLIQRMVAADTQMASDMAGARHIYHNVRAYIKVQRKQVSEAASKELIRTLVLKSETHFQALLKSGLAEYAQNVKEPQKIARQRDNLQRRQQVLEQALLLVQKYNTSSRWTH